MTILVAGYARKSGKTTAVCDIIAATRDAQWTSAKVTSHAHGADLTNPLVLEERQAGSETDTSRYLAAGAHRAFWIRCNPADIRPALMPLMSDNLIVESNSAVGLIPSDLVIFIFGTQQLESKVSARRAAALADLAVPAITEDVLARIRSLLSEPKP